MRGERNKSVAYANRPDANQSAIVRELTQVGATVIDMTGDPRIGFDLLVVFRGVVRVVEVKDGRKPPSDRLLTKREQQRKWDVERAGGVYYVWESAAQALSEIGVE